MPVARLIPFMVMIGAAALSNEPSLAQSMTPMRAEVRSVADSFAVRVYPANPYDHPIKVEIKVYDQDFALVPGARAAASPIMLSTGASRPIVVVIPFDGQTERKVRICAESIPYPNSHSQIRAQICGKFFGRRLS
ncbi:hypothetical protein [Aureimonas sp. ME7]|uniref:hypothetical protein n=1 Tax=Aureimonas sp. ME7 TaxID=2744252 RepID=UPI0015F916FA|nr:hypothetical protein [Aureimonas sp. ME7]